MSPINKLFFESYSNRSCHVLIEQDFDYYGTHIKFNLTMDIKNDIITNTHSNESFSRPLRTIIKNKIIKNSQTIIDKNNYPQFIITFLTKFLEQENQFNDPFFTNNFSGNPNDFFKNPEKFIKQFK